MDKYGAKNNFNTVTSPDEIIFAKSSKQIQLPVCEKTVVTDISEDYILPDYLPDIRRLLSVKVRIPEPSRYVGGDVAEFSGNACWSVIYTGGNGELNCAQLSTPYEVSANLTLDERASPDSEYALFDDIKAESVTAKVNSARKLSLRCKLAHKIRVYGDTDVECSIFGEVNENSIKKLEHTFPVCRITRAYDDSVELEESIEIPENAAVTLIHGNCYVDELFESDGELICNGYVILTLALCENGGVPTFIERKLPFTASLECALDGNGYSYRAYGKISDISVEANGANALCRVSLCVSCDAQKNVPTQICSDIFSTENECNAEMKLYKLPVSVYCGNLTATHESSGVIDGLFEGAEIGDVSCHAECTGITLENGHYVMNGSCKYTVIFVGEKEYASRVSEFPFSAHICDGDETPYISFADLSIISCRIKKEGENFVFSSDISASVSICASNDVFAVCEADFLSPLKSSCSAYKIAYPASNETLWDIAKRYASDPKVLADANGIKASAPDAADSLSGVKYLII